MAKIQCTLTLILTKSWSWPNINLNQLLLCSQKTSSEVWMLITEWWWCPCKIFFKFHGIAVSFLLIIVSTFSQSYLIASFILWLCDLVDLTLSQIFLAVSIFCKVMKVSKDWPGLTSGCLKLQLKHLRSLDLATEEVKKSWPALTLREKQSRCLFTKTCTPRVTVVLHSNLFIQVFPCTLLIWVG